MKFHVAPFLRTIALTALLGALGAHAEESVELTNLGEQETAVEPAAAMPAAAEQSEPQNTPPQRQGATASTGNTDANKGAATATAKPVAPPTVSPMEAYRDLKLQQAATPFGGRPSASRKYLKVDRSTFMDSQ